MLQIKHTPNTAKPNKYFQATVVLNIQKKKKKRIEHTPRTNTLFDGSDLTSGKIHHKVPETSEHIHKHHMDTNLWINLAYKHLMQKSIIQ